MDHEIITVEATVLPSVSAEMMLTRYRTIVEIKDKVMKPDIHYGIVPGAGHKPTLLKPGAETLCTAFMLYPDFEVLEAPDLSAVMVAGIEDVPYFQYRYRCVLYSRDGAYRVGSGIGSCNSWEKKYRYRTAERVCPQCGEATIFKSKREEGWYCWQKKGGCSAQFGLDDPRITEQEVGQKPNPDIAELVNTIDKMAQKRALIAATLIAVGASDFFTQDLDDIPPGAVNQGSAPERRTDTGPQGGSPRPGLNGQDIADLLDRDMGSLEGRDIYRVREYSIAHSDTGHEKHWQNRYAAHFERTPMNKLAGMAVAEFLERMSTPSRQTPQPEAVEAPPWDE